MRYDANISTIEDRSDLRSLTVDQHHGIFIAYEMRTRNNKSAKDETYFKASKTKINQKKKSQSCHHEESNVEEANFIRKIQKGSGKYKGKLPFKCFNCGKIGHFASKFPYPKKTLKMKKIKPNNTRKGFTKGKIIFTQRKKTMDHQNLVTTMDMMMMKSFS
jgi:hypothetical protein